MLNLLTLLLTQNPDPHYLETLYSRQDPSSLTKQLTFYAEYPGTKEGERAKQKVLSLLNITTLDPLMPLDFSAELFDKLLESILKKTSNPLTLDTGSINFITKLSSSHQHKNLKGSTFTTLQEIQNAPSEDIDVGRGMLLLAYENEPLKIKTYEAVLDFMALCIKARLTPTSTSEEIVHAMNHFIFYELGYRFPPFSKHEAHIDTYTLLPSVLDNRQGVCLGVSLLYYALSQRLGLNLSIYTPPGHIFLSLHEELNIETTARGIHIPLENYLSLHIKKLEKRTAKELLGMALFNEASTHLRKESYTQAITLYTKALSFIPNDPLILELLGSCYLMARDLKHASRIFMTLKNLPVKNELSPDYVVEDFFKGVITPEGLKAVFQEVDPGMASLIKKAESLTKIHQKSPRFRSALYQLGITYLQLHQYEQALLAFEKLYPDAPSDPSLLYYLTELSLIRYNRPKTLFYQAKLKTLLTSLDFNPKATKQLFEEIESLWPSSLTPQQP